MKKTAFLSLIAIFLFLFFINHLTPMYFGDDYVYSFVWEGHSIYEPLSENAVRISSWKDLFDSQRLHYLTWSGRMVNHTLAQFFLWKGKALFNICNAFAGMLLVLEIYWCICKGRVTKNLGSGTLCCILILLWSFTPAFGNVFLWLDGACNYLWPIILLTGFSIPYIKKYYSFSEQYKKRKLFGPAMFIFGLLAGCTNENTICWVIFVLVIFLAAHRNNKGMETWMLLGLAGLLTGYALLMLAPGNMVRLYAEQGGNNWLTMESIKKRFSTLAFILCYFQLFLWYFCLRSLYILKKRRKKNNELEKEIMFVKLLCVLAFVMTAIMLFSPGLPLRSGFPGTVCLIIASGILLRLQNEYGVVLILAKAKKFLLCMSLVYFFMTCFVSINHYYVLQTYNDNVIACVKQVKSKDSVVDIMAFREISLKEHIMSGYHITDMGISSDENDWKNAAFARYYGIKGIRIVKNKVNLDTQKTN